MVIPETEKSGIIDYSNFLASALSISHEVEMIGIDPKKCSERGLDYLKSKAMKCGHSDICHVQHAYPVFGNFLTLGKNGFEQFVNTAKIPVILTLHERYLSPRWNLLSSFPGRLLRRGTSLICLKRLARSVKRIISHVPLNEITRSREILDKIDVIPHPIPLNRDSQISSEECKKQFGLENKIVLTIFGFTYSRKNYDLAVKAMKFLGQDYHLLIAGESYSNMASDCWSPKDTEARNLALEGRISVTGYLDDNDVEKALMASDVVLALYDQADGSGSLSFAIAYRRPIVSISTYMTRAIVDESPCLRLVKDRNPETVAAAIQEITGNERIKDQLSSAAGQYASNHTFEQMAKQLDTIYSKMRKE